MKVGKKLSLQRLKQWRKVLLKVAMRDDADKVFDMRSWFHAVRKRIMGRFREVTPTYVMRHNMTCGTTACAAGHAALDPVLRKQGFCIKNGDPYFNGSYSEDAVSEFFGLSYEEAQGIVLPSHYPGYNPDDPMSVPVERVIDRLSDLIREREKQ